MAPLQEQRKAERERRRAEEYAEGFAETLELPTPGVEAEARGEPFNEPEPYQD